MDGNGEPKHGFKNLAHMTHERNVVVINETHLLITDHEYHIYKPQSGTKIINVEILVFGYLGYITKCLMQGNIQPFIEAVVIQSLLFSFSKFLEITFGYKFYKFSWEIINAGYLWIIINIVMIIVLHLIQKFRVRILDKLPAKFETNNGLSSPVDNSTYINTSKTDLTTGK